MREDNNRCDEQHVEDLVRSMMTKGNCGFMSGVPIAIPVAEDEDRGPGSTGCPRYQGPNAHVKW